MPPVNSDTPSINSPLSGSGFSALEHGFDFVHSPVTTSSPFDAPYNPDSAIARMTAVHSTYNLHSFDSPGATASATPAAPSAATPDGVTFDKPMPLHVIPYTFPGNTTINSDVNMLVDTFMLDTTSFTIPDENFVHIDSDVFDAMLTPADNTQNYDTASGCELVTDGLLAGEYGTGQSDSSWCPCSQLLMDSFRVQLRPCPACGRILQHQCSVYAECST